VKRLAVLSVLVGALLAPTAALAGVIGHGSASGQFAVTSASGSSSSPNLFLRGYGRDLSGMAVIACTRGYSVGSRSQEVNSMQSGRLYRLRLPMKGNCDVTGSLSGAGHIMLQIVEA
jgi:hypothetical protein